jgi:chemotaxis methyl-accepting protein methylase
MFDFFKVQEIFPKSEEIEPAKDFQNIPNISKYFKKNTGIDFDDQEAIFKSRITSFCRAHKISSFSSCLKLIGTDKELRQELTDYLTTNESFFYREFHQVEKLVQKVQSSCKNVKILCAPSAQGEEPYSIAIALLTAGVKPSQFHITGIDISLEAIQRAQTAVYNEKAIRNLSNELRSMYFEKESENYHLTTKVKNQVTFKCINIFENEFTQLPNFDYIFSRNMLIYFDTQTRLKAQKLFTSHLVHANTEIYYGHADLTHMH